MLEDTATARKAHDYTTLHPKHECPRSARELRHKSRNDEYAPKVEAASRRFPQRQPRQPVKAAGPPAWGPAQESTRRPCARAAAVDRRRNNSSWRRICSRGTPIWSAAATRWGHPLRISSRWSWRMREPRTPATLPLWLATKTGFGGTAEDVRGPVTAALRESGSVCVGRGHVRRSLRGFRRQLHRIRYVLLPHSK